jgi:LAO/AO transport system kinase
MDDQLLERFRTGDRLALARLLSLAARGDIGSDVLARLSAATTGRVVAFTGSGGVGKSSLIGKSIEHLRKNNSKVAVLACDPQSPLSGGALLGDRFRMPSQPDDGVFIRSLAALSGHQAVADHLAVMVPLLQAFGFDFILIETVGSGQGDTAVRDLADVVVLLLQPETGDDLQWEKAGVLEVADIVVIHKADLPGAEQAAAQIRAALELSGGPEIPVLRVSTKSGDGLAALWETIRSCSSRRGTNHSVGELLHLAQQRIAVQFARAEKGHEPALRELLDRWRDGRLPPQDAGAAVLAVLANRQP